MPRRRTSSASASNASVAAPSRGSFSPANTCPSSRLVSRASARRWRATTQAYPTDSTPNNSTAATRIRNSLGKTIRADIRHERGRQRHGAVWLLVRFQESRDRARQRDARRVQRVHELRFLAGTRPTADVGAACLVVRERAGARDFEPLPDPRGPRLEIVRFGGGEAEVVGRQDRDAVGKLETPEHFFGVRGELLVLCRRIGGAAEAHQLHFVELVYAQQSPRVLSRGSRLAPEARRVGDVSLRQRRAVEN